MLENEHSGPPYGTFLDEIRSYVSACLMSSAASLEALINELFIARNTRLHEQIPNFEKQFWGHGRIEYKSTIALKRLGVDGFDTQSPTFLDTDTLIKWRHFLIHYKPGWGDLERDEKLDFIRDLEGRFALNPFIEDNQDFLTMRCMSAGCAKWAVATTLAFIREFDARAKLDPDKMRGFWEFKA